MAHTLMVETDWDFSIMLDGKLYSDCEFEIKLDSVKQLDEILVGGPFGSPPYLPIAQSNCKVWELQEGLNAIRQNPEEIFGNMGGNRGIQWYPGYDSTPELEFGAGI